MPSIVEAMEKFDAAFAVGKQIYSVEYMAIEQELKPFLTDYKESSRYGDLFLISPQGDTIFSVNRAEELGTNLLTGPFRETELAKVFDRARTLLETGISDFERYFDSNKAAAFIAAPVFTRGKFLGVVALEVTDADIFKLIQDYSGLGETGEIVIGSRRKKGALLISPLRHDPEAAFNKVVPFHTQLGHPIQLAVQGNGGAGLAMDYRGEPVLAVWNYLPSFRWGMVVKIDAKEAFAPIAQLRNITIAYGLIFMFILAVGALYLGNSISKPLSNLVSQSKRFRRYDFSHRVQESGPYEVRNLAEAFNEMAAELDKSYAKLNSQLAELSQTNTLLEREITERQRAEESLRQKERQLQTTQKMEAIGTLAGGIAHDFNNILGAILGYTELAIQKADTTSRLHHNLQEVLVAGHRAKDLVHQILMFSRRSEPEPKPMNLVFIVRECIRMLRPTIPSSIEIRQTLAEDAGHVLADATQIQQVLINLCTNAEHAIRGTEGVLELSLEHVEVTQQFSEYYPELKPGPHAKVMVRDTGRGMAPDVVQHIFEPFFTTKEVGEGTGMGLAVAHGIIRSHGGAITVDTAIDRGTTFSVYLPLIDGIQKEDLDHEEGPILEGTGCILFIDDEEPLVQVGKEMLEQLGYEVIVETSSANALATFQKTPMKFDAVITDQTMPHMTGETLARELLQIRPHLPIILCTGYSHTITKEKASSMGISAFLTKPILRRELGFTLGQLLVHQPQTK